MSDCYHPDSYYWLLLRNNPQDPKTKRERDLDSPLRGMFSNNDRLAVHYLAHNMAT